MSRTVYYAAASSDGFIATSDGGVGWLDPFQSAELGYERFLAGVGAVVMGRATYDQTLSFGAWPYTGRRGLVLTSRPLRKPPGGVVGVSRDDLGAALATLREEAAGDVFIVGGGRTAAACMDVGMVDEIELYVVPRLLGAGIGLLERRERMRELRLRATHAFSNGVVMVRYGVAA